MVSNISETLKATPNTGTYTATGWSHVFEGDGKSDLQVFTMPADAKVLNGPSVSDFPADTTFSVTASWDGGSRVLELPVNGTAVQGPELPVGTVVTFTEATPPTVDGYTFEGVVFSPSSITIEDEKNPIIEATNTYTKVETGGFTISKGLCCPDALGFGDAMFSVAATITEPGQDPQSHVFEVPADGKTLPENTVTGLPLGTTVKFEEVTDNMPTPPPGWVWQGVTFEPAAELADDTLTIEAGMGSTGVVAVNQYLMEKGSFSIQKKLVGIYADDFPEGAFFRVKATVEEPGERGKTYSLITEVPANGETIKVGEGIPAGSAVTFTEVEPANTPNGWVFEGAEFSPAKLVVKDGEEAVVTLTNTYTEDPNPEPVAPSVVSEATVAGGGKVLASKGGQVEDTLRYQGLIPGAKYTMKGEIRTVPDAAPIGVSSQTVFVAEKAQGNTTVTFSLTAKDVAPHLGKQLVIFEYLYDEDGTLVAQDASVDHLDQRFSVHSGGGDKPEPDDPHKPGPDRPHKPGPSKPSKPGYLPKTGAEGIVLIGLLGPGAVAAGAVLVIRRRKG